VTPLPPYASKVLAAIQVHGIAPGAVQVVHILHDDDCRIFSGRPCTCDPDVRIVTRGGPEPAPSAGAPVRAHRPAHARPHPVANRLEAM